jgi:glycosyltransferase involved in cell wall biosynthesis
MRDKGAPRVLVISHLFPRAENPGLGCFIHEQVRALRQRQGVDARVVCGRPHLMRPINPWALARTYRDYRRRFRALHWQEWQGVPVLYVPYLAGGFFRFWLQGSTYRAAVMGAAPWIRRNFPFELVHAHTSYQDGTAALALRTRYHVPYVLTEHTGPFRCLLENSRIRRQSLRALARADKVWCVSSSLADEVRSHLPARCREHIHTLANGVDTSVFHPPPHWAPDPAAPRLLGVLALEENKAPLLLLEAFRRLRQAVPGATLDLVGQGPLEEAVRAFIRTHDLGDSVLLWGQCPRQDVARLMRERCDVLVLCSHSETFGVVLIEALASGKPVVATRCGGPNDIITEPSLGALCPPGDVESLTKTLILVTRSLASFNGRTIRQRAQERFDYGHLAATLAAEYEEQRDGTQTTTVLRWRLRTWVGGGRR